jgi:cysteine synthase B
MGAARSLKARNPGIQAVAVHPGDHPTGLTGLKDMARAIVPGIYDPALADAHVEVATAAGQAMARRLALEEGLLVGPSSGAGVHAALELARGLKPGSVVVTVLFDTGARYLAEPFW